MYSKKSFCSTLFCFALLSPNCATYITHFGLVCPSIPGDLNTCIAKTVFVNTPTCFCSTSFMLLCCPLIVQHISRKMYYEQSVGHWSNRIHHVFLLPNTIETAICTGHMDIKEGSLIFATHMSKTKFF